MRNFPIFIIAAASFAAASLAAAPPREQSPAPRDILALAGAGNSDEELARAVAAAQAHPLGSLQNPIRVGGPEGVRAYLARLRCGDGNAPAIGRKQGGGTGAFGSVTEQYGVDCRAAAPGRVTLLLDIYHDGHEEDRAPAGFRLEPRRPVS
jgi:hypothetical protein